MAEAKRINPHEAHDKVESGEALLVCAYDDEQKCKSMKLEGSISLKEMESRLSSVPKEKEIIFYCA
ncbi:MAG: ArsR family transcriptional regulator [Candidatus Abyssobacteria bacterium SURF_5]|uniref:ArsR family transcriptional regulator n=1 Tax=Abyssobacteria bacterium (strain SURF_5) TaxID=2093360 RepID=A0A3A4P450_ABYX5|nr:MAG: ArsR family transcriptional regulator [Candidatus Abyssubacteria bacterium SURF_5]